jgi:hypothetical protein
VDFISANESVHFSSVLAYHPASKTIHADDTLMYLRLPLVGGVRFHPTLSQALLREPGATAAFQAWAEGLAARWGDARSLCAAHSAALLDVDDLPDQIRAALSGVAGKLRNHERRGAR